MCVEIGVSMKKIVVAESQINEEDRINIELELTSHFAYGLYEFNPERMVEDISHKYKLTLDSIMHPFFNLTDSEGNELKLKFVEENY